MYCNLEFYNVLLFEKFYIEYWLIDVVPCVSDQRTIYQGNVPIYCVNFTHESISDVLLCDQYLCYFYQTVSFILEYLLN